MQISPTKSTFFLGKNFGDTRHPYKKNEPTLDHSGGGGVHGKACWLIAYQQCLENSIKCDIPIPDKNSTFCVQIADVNKPVLSRIVEYFYTGDMKT